MSQWSIEFYQLSNESSPVLDWLSQQNPKVKAKFAHIFQLLKTKGTLLGMPHVRFVQSKLYEIRVEQNTNIYRILYFAHTNRRFILLHGFQKKTVKTPKKEIETAEVRLKDFLANTED